MSFVKEKNIFKMKSQGGDFRTLKPILPKLNPMITQVIEINAPTIQMCKCFVCDERVVNSGVPLLQSTTQISNTDLPTKIGQLMGEKFMVVVSADDVLCRKCHALVNHVDKLESDLLLVKRSLRNHLKKKYGLNDDLKETESKDSEIELKYAVLQGVKSEDDLEPLTKRLRQSRPVRFRAIKPKPPGSLQAVKCPSCSFVTTEPDRLSCHRLVCSATAYKCTMCDKKFDSQKLIRNHKIEAHLTKWICHFCNISFNEEKKFTFHMKNHLGDKFNTKTVNIKSDGKKGKALLCFKCPHCVESFEAFSQLQIHLINHTSSVTFKCVKCDIGFQTKQDLIEHVKSHDEIIPEEYILPESPEEKKAFSENIFSCSACSLNFFEEEIYLQHLNIHKKIDQDDQIDKKVGLYEKNCKKGTQKISSDIQLNFNEKKKDVKILEMHNLTECLNVEKNLMCKANDKIETDSKNNAGEEASHIELNQLLCVNSLNLQLVDGNTFQNAKVEKNEVTNSESERNENNNSVEDILEKMFQVKEEDKSKIEDQHDETLEKNQPLNDYKESKKKTYVCAECTFSTYNLNELKQHFIEAHEAFKCWICKKSFQIKELKQHLASAHGANHVQNHSVALHSKAYSCIHCSEKFTNRRALHLHEVTHPENLNIQCPDCGEKFARDKFLNEHREISHVISHCRICNKSFGNVKQIKSHEARHVKSSKSEFKCTDCNRIFQTPTGLRHHKAIHTGEFKYKCEFCDKGFVARVRYEEHRASHTKEERYSCEICGKKFSFQATYWIHRKWHDNPTPYKCEYCGRLFKHSSLLSVHKRKHTGIRPYECPHCDQSFTVGNTLKRHLMLHTGVFPFNCQICDQGFSGKHKMALHMSKVHQDNSLLEQQTQRKPVEYKMVVKPDEAIKEEVSLEKQTWILSENESNKSQLLTIQTEKGENIPCTLLTDDMINNIVNSNNKIVEIISYDSIKTENLDEGNEGGFILMNHSDRSGFGMVSDDEDLVKQVQANNENYGKKGNCYTSDNIVNKVQFSLNNLEKHIKQESANNGVIPIEFVTGL